MIISHQYKYLFVELPRTGSTAISQELCENYDGLPILHKHATYYEFLKIARDEEKKYFTFSGIRNPLDVAVSLYFRLKTEPYGRYTDPKKLARKRNIVDRINKRMFDFIREKDADFPAYFMKYYRIPYNTWSSLSHKEFDFIIQFENLAGDFAQALNLIGIEPKRPLPIVNSTLEREKKYLSYYTPETINRAKRVFGLYMKQWGYEFPPEWGKPSLPWWNQMEFEFFNLLRNVYWRYLRYRILSTEW